MSKSENFSKIYEMIDSINAGVVEFVEREDFRQYSACDLYEKQAQRMYSCHKARIILSDLAYKVHDLLRSLSGVSVSITAAEWNRWYKVGTDVVYFSTPSLSTSTKTKSAAWVSPGDDHLVGLEGVDGGVSLYNVIPVSALSKKGKENE